MLTKVSYRNFIIKQNFKRISPNLIWTLRLRSLWLYRNTFTLIFLYQQLLLNNAPHFISKNTDQELNYLTQFVLVKKLYFLLTHIYLKSYTVRVSNFSRSCDYWSLSNSVNYVDDYQNKLKITPTLTREWYSVYVRPYSLIGLFISKKLYKIEMISFILLLLYNWRSLNTYRLYLSGYPILTKEWLLVPFFGNYYFKQLNF